MARQVPVTSAKLVCTANYEAFQVVSSGGAAIIQLNSRELATIHINLDAVATNDNFIWQLLAGSQMGAEGNWDAVTDASNLDMETGVHTLTTDDEFAGMYVVAMDGDEKGEWRLITAATETDDGITVDHAFSGAPSAGELYRIYKFSVWDSGIIVPLTTPTIANPQNAMSSIMGPDFFMVQGKSESTPDAHNAYMTYQKDGVSV